MKNENKTNRGVNKTRRNLTVGGAVGLLASPALANSMNPPAENANPNKRFEGKTVAITGGNSGIGAATARAFALEGAKVFITARRDALGKKVEASIRDSGGDANWLVTDVREPRQVKRFIEAASAGGGIDVLFNNAGIFMTPAAVEDLDIANFRDMMQTNVEGVFYGMKYALPKMKARGGGVIINMSSVAGARGYGNVAHYCASKHAVRGLTKAAATVSAKENIRVVSISPLAVDTPMLQRSFEFQGLTYEKTAPHFVTPRIMDPLEIARAVMFLASDEATAVNGMDLDATGGQLA